LETKIKIKFMKTCDFRQFGWNFFKINNQIVLRSEALVKEDTSLKGAFFTVALAFFIIMGTAQFLSMVEDSLNARRASASTIENRLENIILDKPKDNAISQNPLLVLHKIPQRKAAREFLI